MAKKNPLKNSLILMIAVFALMALSQYVLVPKFKERESASETAKLLFPGLERTDIIEFSMESKERGKILFQRKAENNEDWTVTGEKSFDGDKVTVEGIISSLLASKVEERLQSTDLKNFGLDEPKTKLSMTMTKTHDTRELLIGNDTPVDYFVYAKWSNDPGIFLTSRSLRFALDKKLDDLRNRKIFKKPELEKIDRLEIKSLATESTPSQNIRLKRDSAGQWTSTIGTNEVLLESKQVEDFLERMSNLTVKGFASERPEERTKFGLQSPVASLAIQLKDRAEPQLWLLGKVRERATTPGATKSTMKDTFYFALKEQDGSYEVADTFQDNFKINLFDFRRKSLPSPNLNKIARIDIVDAQNKGLRLYRKPKGDDWQVSLASEEQSAAVDAKKELVDLFLSGILNMKAEDFKDGMSPFATGTHQPLRKIDMLSADGKVLETYRFGRKLKDGNSYIGVESLRSPAVVSLKIEELLPLDINVLRKEPAPTNKASTEKIAPPNGGIKVKLEPTVTDKKDIKKLPASIVRPDHKYTGVMKLASGAKLGLTFFPKDAPYTVSNFLHLARNHYYDGVVFHRVIADFVVQGGDPTGSGRGGPGYMFDNEDNSLKHLRGFLSMAHAGKNTNGSQFFIVLKPQPHLDNVHTVFAQVTEGLDLIESIKQGDKISTVEVFEETP